MIMQAESRLVFVPGLGDAGPGAILPRPPLPESLIGALREQLPTALFASNPCRIRHFNQACPNNPLLSLLCHSTTTNLSTVRSLMHAQTSSRRPCCPLLWQVAASPGYRARLVFCTPVYDIRIDMTFDDMLQIEGSSGCQGPEVLSMEVNIESPFMHALNWMCPSSILCVFCIGTAAN